MLKSVAVVALVVVVASLAYVAGRFDWPHSWPEQRLVSSGVQSVTICEKHDGRIFEHLADRMPGVDVGLWGPVTRGDCTTWYHYAEGGE